MPSRFVVRCLSEMGAAPPNAKAIDVPCGYGRHSFAAIECGYKVTAIDVSSDRVAYVRDVAVQLKLAERIDALTQDIHDTDLATLGPFDLAIVTDFSDLALLVRLSSCIISDAHLILETPAGHGGNWRALPETGATRDVLSESFNLVRYIERAVGPPSAGRVTVKCLAQRR
jgi:SAM-dependent methyltransferase